MGQQKYAQEFRAEAVRQVVDLGCDVEDVAQSLGVAPAQLYKRVNQNNPTR